MVNSTQGRKSSSLAKLGNEDLHSSVWTLSVINTSGMSCLTKIEHGLISNG